MAELVGGAFLSAALQVAFEKLASSEIFDFFQRRNLDETLLEKLHIILISVNQVIEDAEELQYRNTNVKKWLDELRHVVFKAEDIIDEIDTEASQQKLQAESQSIITKKVWGFLTPSVTSFDKEIEPRIQKVLDSLEYLIKQNEILGLKARLDVGTELRCFMLFQRIWHYSISSKALLSTLGHLKYVRALSFVGEGNLERLPNDIGNLKHLRCHGMTKLPSNFHKLINLCHLDLEGSSIMKAPKYMRKLKSLAIRSTEIVVEDARGSNLKELGTLKYLRDLRIGGCPKLIASWKKDWGVHNLLSLEHIEVGDDDDIENVESFPAAPNLRSICFVKCSKLKAINYMALGDLRYLQYLGFEDCPLMSFENFPDDEQASPISLSELHIRGNCPLLKQRCRKYKGQDWPKVSHIPGIRIL
ncbi:putative disease resistance RPP13-like protein 1 [Senna tora]|uniref:Putative disease resistance RPP13-like protein 1 n=1 Tax=Senna tora TaxID=362788 RepID=A0A834TLV2_9FABA|nr:putative disease resistance RPP13-like protein 1 [Senna tora]